jgi:hypothetical protein
MKISLNSQAIFRFLFFGLFSLFIGLHPYFIGFLDLPDSLWYPIGLLKIFSSPPRFEFITYGFILWQSCLILVIFGILRKYSLWVVAVLGLFYINLAHSYGYISHAYMPLCLAFFAWSLFDRDLKELLFSLQFIFCIVFFSAGCSKLLNGGLEWITSDGLQLFFARSHFIYPDVNFFAGKVGLNLWIIQYPLLCKILAGFVIIFELMSPVALFSKKYRPYMVGVLFVMQIAIYFTVYVNFKTYIPLYLAWLPWEKIKSYQLTYNGKKLSWDT